MAPKRARERRVQTWLDPQNPDHQYLIQVVDWYKINQNMNQSQVIIKALVSLAQVDDIPIPMPETMSLMDSKLDRMQTTLNELIGMVRSGGVIGSTPQQQSHIERFQQEYDELTAEEEGIAAGYKAFRFDDE